jgi:hypothetical protein
MLNIEDITYGEMKRIAAMVTGGEQPSAAPSGPWHIGKNYFIRTVTMIVTGRLVAVHAQELVLVDAAWIADTDRYAQAVASGNFMEVEPYPDGREVIVGRGGIIDATTIPVLPRIQK